MTKVNLTKILDRSKPKSEGEKLVEWGLITLITDVKLENLGDSINEDGHHVFDFDFKINGVPVDPTDMFKRLSDSYNKDIARKAKELYEDKYYDATVALQEATNLYLDRLNIKPEDIE